jgi:hypothetical protein
VTETLTAAQQASIDLFFSLDYEQPDAPEGVERDRYERPLILPPGGDKKIPYTRCSTLAGYVENKKGLHTWDMRHVAHGVGLDPDIAAKAASIQPLTGNRKKDRLSNETLDECIEEARKVAGEHKGRDWGTAVHGFTEPGQEGNPRVPERMQDDVDSYWGKMHEYGLRNVASEVFVVNHELRVAGTFDDLYYGYAFGLTLGDKKTGKAKIHSHLIQLATYSRSEVYDPETDTSAPIQSLVEGDPAKYPINEKVGFWVHIPKGEGVTRFVGLNLEVGWEAAKNAARVRDFQQRKHDLTFDAHEQLLHGARTEAAWEALNGATVLEEFSGIANHYRDVWTPRMTEFGQRRITELGLRAA